MAILRGKKRTKANELYQVRQKINELKKIEKQLSEDLKKEVDFGEYNCGDVDLYLSQSEANVFDSKKAKKILTEAQIKKCMSKQVKVRLDVKKVA